MLSRVGVNEKRADRGASPASTHFSIYANKGIDRSGSPIAAGSLASAKTAGGLPLLYGEDHGEVALAPVKKIGASRGNSTPVSKVQAWSNEHYTIEAQIVNRVY